jgi:hypothetical protein
VNSKSGEHVFGVKPLGKPLLHRINKVIVKKEILFCLGGIESHNHLEEKYYHSEGMVSDERNNRTRRWKGGFQGRFHRDGQTPTSEGHHSKSSDLSKSQNIRENNREKKMLGGKGQHE